MGIGSWGGGIILGLVAVLWLVYLIPSWHKRQEYLATERNAVRLQQTLRILAQTAELPEEVRVEANAKSVASAQRILRTEETKREAIRRAQEAARQRAVTRELAATAPVLRAADSEPALAARRLRRTRLAATAVLAAGLIGFVLGVAVLGGWLLVAASVIAGIGSVVVLTQLSAVSRARARRLASAGAGAGAGAEPLSAQPFQDFAPNSGGAESPASVGEGAQDALGRVAARQWTPVAMPRPLYLRRGSARALARSSASAASPTTAGDSAALVAAAERSAAALRESQEAARHQAQQEALREVARAEAALQGRRVAEAAGAAGGVRDGGVAPSAARGQAERAAAVAGVATPGSSDSLAASVSVAAPASLAAPTARAPQSRFARMGYVDESDLEELRLDEVLSRRRAI